MEAPPISPQADVRQVREINLVQSASYDITMDVPLDNDFDLYLFHLDFAEGANTSQCIARSDNGLGMDESILNFTPTNIGSHFVAVIRINGSSHYLFSYEYHIPESDAIPFFGGWLYIYFW